MVISVASSGRRLFWSVMCMVLFCVPQLATASEDDAPVLLLLEVRLDTEVIAEAIPAYERDGQILLPLGELARALTIGIQTRPDESVASGFILSPERSFSLNVNSLEVTWAGQTRTFEPSLVLAEPDDIYVASELLERWFPVVLEVQRSSQVLHVDALEELPLQAQWRRERMQSRPVSGGRYEAPRYVYRRSPYRMLDIPFIDQTLEGELQKNNGETEASGRYTAFLTGDLLGMESSLYVAAGTRESDHDVRATVGRSDPDGELLGPLQARSYRLGSFTSPSVDNLVRGKSGEGISVTNRPLTQPSSFDSQTLEGDLPPGWDVELYYNNALVDFQQARADGRYRFEDLPLSYGRNDFRLVFHGPLGQTRVEEYNFLLDSSMARPGELRYNLSEHRDEDGESRSVGQLELGLGRNLTASTSFIRAPLAESDVQYSSLGLRAFWRSMSLNGNYVRSDNGGRLWEMGMQTRLSGMSIDAGRIYLDDFVSDEFSPFLTDPVRLRDEVRLAGIMTLGEQNRIPATLELTRDQRESGEADTTLGSRLSAYVFRTALTNTLSWQDEPAQEKVSGSFLLSRRVYGMGVRGVMNYDLHPRSKVTSVSLTADYDLLRGYRVNWGVVHDFNNPLTSWSAGFSKNLGRYGLGLNGRYMTDGNYAVGLQLFVGMGSDPVASDWHVDAQPLAGYGAVSARVFLDENDNGVMDDDEKPITDAGFNVNGSRREVRTDETGLAHLGRLPVKRYVDVALDRSSLIDPQWQPSVEGHSLIPRPGHVVKLEFPVRLTTEIDGTVFLSGNGAGQGVGGLELELLDEHLDVVSTATTAWDGFYIMPAVPPGQYWLKLSKSQLARLDMEANGFRVVDVPDTGEFVSGVDLWVTRSEPSPAPKSSNLPVSVEFPVSPKEIKRDSVKRKWIDGQPDEHFTIQLMAASSENTVRKFRDRHGIAAQSVYYRSRFRGAPWYSLIYGTYENYGAARGALKNLPERLKAAGPWIKRFGDIREEMEVVEGSAP
ncbi:SPOR domain-containing protein [Marinobacter alexandrii]|uniref:SPOR domain-containing protein n=1 Tax=Marinobacter alexandrii TaxID=2570351 RepID=UPI0020003C4D|nr:SPOR domain-containing protein [Marinobacter alexandrii]MCK2149279.1 SPOR domain-containing protein [Marinobacter alexandrii]